MGVLFSPLQQFTAKKVGCFNHRVVTLVADNCDYERFALLLETNSQFIRKPHYNHSTLKTLITSVLPSPGYQLPACTKSILKCICNDSFTDVLKVVSVLWLKDELGSCLLGCVMELVIIAT